jgi:hypothetical protein
MPLESYQVDLDHLSGQRWTQVDERLPDALIDRVAALVPAPEHHDRKIRARLS